MHSIGGVFISNNERKSTTLPSIIPLVLALLFVLLFCVLQSDLVQILTPFLMVPIKYLCLAIVIAVYIINLARTIKAIIEIGPNKRLLTRLIIIIIFIAIIGLAIFLPLDDYYENARFSSLSEQFDAAAIIMSQTGAGDGYNAALPFEYAYLSRGGGDIIICGTGDNKAILFYCDRGILDGFSVYAYAPNQNALKNLWQYTDWSEFKKLRENWYYCRSS